MKNSMISKTSCLSIALAIGSIVSLSLPAQARFDYLNWQPMVGPIHQQENNLEVQMNKAYVQGLIDSNELAQLRRDLDGIMVKEDQMRADHNGLGTNDRRVMKQAINQFQNDLYQAEADKFCIKICRSNNNN